MALCTSIVLPTSFLCCFVNTDTRDRLSLPREAHLGPSRETAVVERLYEKLNALDARGTAACFQDDVVYEDLMFGDSSITASREQFEELIGSQPVFVCAEICRALDLPPWKIMVDSISEDPVRHTVAVAWHVEADGGTALVLGRGLSFFHICPETGLIDKASDISEAPWRALGWVLAPSVRRLRGFKFQDLLSDLAITFVGTVVVASLIFLDKGSLAEVRQGLDAVDDFRNSLDTRLPKSLCLSNTDINQLLPLTPCENQT